DPAFALGKNAGEELGEGRVVFVGDEFFRGRRGTRGGCGGGGGGVVGVDFGGERRIHVAPGVIFAGEEGERRGRDGIETRARDRKDEEIARLDGVERGLVGVDREEVVACWMRGDVGVGRRVGGGDD